MTHDLTLPLTEQTSTAALPRRAELARLGGVLLVGLVLRLVLLWRFADVGLAIHDERDYDQIAVSIVQQGEFALTPGQLTSIRPPLYPALVAGIYSVAGVQNYQAVRVVQIVLSLVTAGLVYLLARRVYDQRVALVAAGLYCIYPSLVGATALVLTETLFTLLLCGFLLLVERYFTTKSRAALAAAGLVLGLAALTRSVVWLFPPFAALFVLFLGSEKSWSGRLLSAATFVLVFAATLAPWTIRNTRLQQTFTTVDVMGGRNVMMGNYEYTPAYRPWAAIEIEGETAWHRVLSRHHGGLPGKTQGQIDKLAMKYAIGYIAAHPGQTAGRSAAKLFHFWQLERELLAGARQGIWGDTSTLVVLLMAGAVLGVYCATMLLSIFGIVLLPPKNLAVHGFWLLLLAFVTALHCAAFAHSRYHLPLMPILMVYAAAAWVNLASVRSRWRTWRFAAASAVCLVLAASWVWDIAVEMGRF